MGRRDDAEYWLGMWREQIDTNIARTEEMGTRHLLDLDELKMRHREEISNLKAGFVEETRQSNAATAERTRQETLETVLKALDLPGYRADGGFSVRIGIKPEYPTDRFWADINTALEVRAERRAADERAATEAKIADLNKREGGDDGLNRSIISVRDLLADPAGPAVLNNSFAAAQQFDKPQPTKKTAKKGKSA